MPFKRDVIPLLDALDPLAERIGAVNTIVNDEGRLTGYNTDALGAVRALEEVRPLAGARVLVLGAGGAARAVVFGLVDRGARVTVANRTRARAEELADAAGATSEGWDAVILASSAFDILVNATSRGMVEVHTESPIPASAIGAAHLVMDIVYKPIATTLVLAARSQGATVVHGGRMLLHQAAGQFELYTGVRAPLEAMDAALQAQIDDAPAPAR
jgi:shikimate dehydrogenase